MTKQRLIARCAVMSALLLAAGCQATSPVYQSYFVSISEGADEAARITAAQARCDAEAHVEAQGAYVVSRQLPENDPPISAAC